MPTLNATTMKIVDSFPANPIPTIAPATMSHAGTPSRCQSITQRTATTVKKTGNRSKYACPSSHRTIGIVAKMTPLTRAAIRPETNQPIPATPMIPTNPKNVWTSLAAGIPPNPYATANSR